MIKRIQIENFKSFGKVDIEPHPGVNLLIGPNSSGKSNFLEALRYSSSFSHAESIGLGFKQFAKSANTNLSSSLDQKIALDLIGPLLSDSNEGLSLNYNVESIYVERKGFVNSFVLGFREEKSLIASKQLFSGSEVDFKGVQSGYLNDFHIRFSQYLRFFKPSVSKIRLGKPLEVFKNFEDDLSNLVFYLDLIRDKNIDSWDTFNEQLLKLTSEFKLITKEIIEDPDGEKTVELLFHTVTGSQLAPTEVSDGIIIFSAILAVLSQPNPPKVILLEEPENGIHPRRIVEIYRLITKLADEKKVQFFITTHSPILLNQFSGDPECVWVFDKEDGVSKIKNLHHDILEPRRKKLMDIGVEDPSDLTDDLGENWLLGLIDGVPPSILPDDF